jgi:hypothetical protein
MLPKIYLDDETIVMNYEMKTPKAKLKDYPFLISQYEVRLEISEVENIIKALEILYDKITLSHIGRDMFYIKYNFENNIYSMYFKDHGDIYFHIIFDEKEKESLIRTLKLIIR